MILLLLSLFASSWTLSCAWLPVTTPVRFTATRNQHSKPILTAAKTDEDLLPTVREGIAEQDSTVEWNQCVALLEQELGISSSQAEIYLAAALEWRGWARVTSALARKYMKPKLPNRQQLQTALNWLRQGPLALTDGAVLLDAIEKSPAAYLVNPEAAYGEALETAPNKYQNADAFKALVLDDPSVLECSYNCVDDGCASECGNCWVSYEIKRGGQPVEV